MCKCETCDTGRAEVIVNWNTGDRVSLAAVCECCAAEMWNRIAPGTSAYATYTIRPYSKSLYKRLVEQVEEVA